MVAPLCSGKVNFYIKVKGLMECRAFGGLRRRFEVPAPPSANSAQELQMESGT
jgi:hypothetical protein